MHRRHGGDIRAHHEAALLEIIESFGVLKKHHCGKALESGKRFRMASSSSYGFHSGKQCL